MGPRKRLVRRRKNLPSHRKESVVNLLTHSTEESLPAETRLIRQKVKRKKRPNHGGSVLRPSFTKQPPKAEVALPSIMTNATVPNHPDDAKRCE